jgi:hypothetical protein
MIGAHCDGVGQLHRHQGFRMGISHGHFAWAFRMGMSNSDYAARSSDIDPTTLDRAIS